MTTKNRLKKLREIKFPLINDPFLIDKKTGKRSCREWLNDNDNLVGKFLEDKFHPNDQNDILQYFWNEPKMAKMLVSDYFKSNEEKQETIKNIWDRGKSKIGLIIGGRGSGKTAFGFWLIDKIKDQRKICFVGDKPTTREGESALPNWIEVYNNPLDTPRGCFVLIDEAGIQVSAREFYYKGNLNLTKMLTVLRHQDKSILFISQHSSLIDINVIRMADCLFYKKQSSFQAITERKLSTSWMAELIKNMLPKKQEEVLFQGSSIIKFKHGLASFWTDDISKSWSNIKEILNKREQEKENKVKKKTKNSAIEMVI